MIRTTSQLAGVVLALVAAASSTQVGPAVSSPASTDSLAIKIDRIFSDWDHSDSPGCAVAVSRGDTLLYEHGYGVSDVLTQRPINPQTVFQAGSVSKQFTAFAILLLAREGRLSLDAPVDKYLPQWSRAARAVTVRQLLTHTSGLRDAGELWWLATGDIEGTLSQQQALDLLARQRGLNFEPGTSYLYTNVNYVVLAAIVARVSRQPFSTFAEQRIFKPLGMNLTRFEEHGRTQVGERAVGHDRKTGEAWTRWSGDIGAPGASGLWTTVGDLLKWEANFDHPKVGDAELLRQMQANTILAGDSTGLGFGLSVDSYRGTPAIGTTGSDIGFRAYVGRLPKHRYAIATLCNARTAVPLDMANKVTNAVLGPSLDPEAPVAAPMARASAAAPAVPGVERYAGVFESIERNEVLWINARGGQLLVAGGATSPRAARFPLRQLGNGRFSMPWGDVVTFAPGDSDRFDRKSWSNKTRFERRAEVKLGREQLSEYAGRYYSDELQAANSVTANDSTLTFRAIRGTGFTLAPSFRDAFDGRSDYSKVNVKFERDATGRVTGFVLNTGIVTRIRFVR